MSSKKTTTIVSIVGIGASFFMDDFENVFSLRHTFPSTLPNLYNMFLNNKRIILKLLIMRNPSLVKYYMIQCKNHLHTA